jgi:hypothetical protein
MLISNGRSNKATIDNAKESLGRVHYPTDYLLSTFKA